jgi:hypothetical protein
MHERVIGRTAVGLTLIAAASALLVACSADPSASYFPAARATPDSHASALAAGAVAKPPPGTLMPLGPIARPDPKLTPGVVSSTDVTTICRQSKRTAGIFSARSPLISLSDQQAIFNEYHIPPLQAKHFGLDFLVPLQLGGANTTANIWPVPLSRGLGFHQKEVLNIRVHIVVCHGEMSIDQAQRAFSSDWVKLWVLYGG